MPETEDTQLRAHRAFLVACAKGYETAGYHAGKATLSGFVSGLCLHGEWYWASAASALLTSYFVTCCVIEMGTGHLNAQMAAATAPKNIPS